MQRVAQGKQMDDAGKQVDEGKDLGAAIKKVLLRFRLPIAAALFLLALVFGWDAWNQGAAGRASQNVASESHRIKSEVEQTLAALTQHFNDRLSDKSVVAAVVVGDNAAAAKALVTGWSGAGKAEFIAPDLTTQYANAKSFGYGRIAVLDKALQSGATAIAVARVNGEPSLLLAGLVKQEGEVKALALLPLPLDTITGPVQAANAGGGYLDLRYHGFTVTRIGNPKIGLLGDMVRTDVGDSGFRVRSASPVLAQSSFGLGPIADYILALLLMIGAVAMLRYCSKWIAQDAGQTSVEEADATTLADLMESERQAAPPVVVREAPKRAAVAIERSIFRAYDIRGVVGQTLDAGVAKLIGQAIGTAMEEQGLKDIVVGRDGRLSGPAMSDALIEGLRLAGRDVIDIGEAPTPLCYFAAFQLRTGSCVAVTGSHNPPDYNGFKIVLGGDTLAGDAIHALYERMAEDRLHKTATPGMLSQREVAADYIHRIAEDVQLERKLKVVVDCGNGVAGMIAPEVLEAIGCEVIPIFCEVDGNFPNHHPDPSEPKNLADAIHMVQRLEADIGLAFDGDGDRLGVVTRAGEIIYPDRLLMLFAADVLERNPGACIVYDVKCTGHLAGHILRHGGSPLMWKTGHSLIKAKMKETGAELAGEMSGHFFFKERWYGFDDGIYAAARLLEILASRDENADAVFAELPKGFSTPELKAALPEGENHAFIDKFREQAKFEGARVTIIDGVRADWPDGWGLVRASNTTPVLVMRFDADTSAALQRIQNVFRQQLLAVKPDLTLPF